MSYCKIWIYWDGVNTKFTIWQLAHTVNFVFTPPSKFKFYNMTCISQNLGAVPHQVWQDKDSCRIGLSHNFAEFHQYSMCCFWYKMFISLTSGRKKNQCNSNNKIHVKFRIHVLNVLKMFCRYTIQPYNELLFSTVNE